MREYREDLRKRFQMIKEHIPILTGKSIIDIGCANGWFPIMFLKEGMSEGVGIETQESLIEEANFNSKQENVNFKCVNDISLINGKKFDYCLYLDLHFHSHNYLPWIKEHCRTLFVSPAQDSSRNIQLEHELVNYFGGYELIGDTGYNGRNLYRVINNELP